MNSFLNRWGVHRYEAGWLGYPTTDEIVHTDGVGRRQEFQRGAIYVAFVNAIGSAIPNGPIRDKWNSLGGHTGWLGYLTSDELAIGTTKYHDFIGGRIYDTAFADPEAVTHIQNALTTVDNDKCNYVALQAGNCYTNNSFEGALDDMSECLYPETRDPTDKNWSDDTVIAIIKSPSKSEPELALTCGVYRDHIVRKHNADEDPENFLACTGLVYNFGFSVNAETGNLAKGWDNNESHVRSTVAWLNAGLPREKLLTSFAGPYVDLTNQRGDDWGGCAKGYIEDRPRP